jgi:hypothetical protein
MLQYLLFIAMIDLSRTCDSSANLICNALVMFMIYSWIKIKLKVPIYPTVPLRVLPQVRFPMFLASIRAKTPMSPSPSAPEGEALESSPVTPPPEHRCLTTFALGRPFLN